jgi:hypothetical protein
MHRIDDPTAVATLPAPRPVGTPGYFTGGSPGSGGFAATIVRYEFMNALQEEISHVIEGAGLTLDKTNNTQLSQALLALFGAPVGQCRLEFTSTTALVLAPYNGNRITINGASHAIPPNLVLSNASLAASTKYYVYCFINAGALALEASPTGHATDGTAANAGVEIKSGDSTRTLVGMIYTDTSAHFQMAPTAVGVLSWFNRRSVQLSGNPTAGATATSTTPGELSTLVRVGTLTWVDEAVQASCWGYGSCNTANSTIGAFIGVDGSVTDSTAVYYTSGAIGGIGCLVASTNAILAEGWHVLSPFGSVTSAGTVGTFTLSVQGSVVG